MEVSDIEVGMDTPKITHKGQRMGPILLDAEDRNQLEYLIGEIQRTLYIKVKSNKGTLKDICWN